MTNKEGVKPVRSLTPQDAEGLQAMRTLARNMTFLMRSIALGREKHGLPQREPPQRTNFIR